MLYKMCEALGPVGFGKLRSVRRLTRWINGYQRTFLPLEQITCPQDIFTLSIELHRSLDTLECMARVELSYKFSIINAVNFVLSLYQNQAYALAFCYVRSDVI